MFETVAKLKVPYILMHMKGTPQNMQKDPTYENIITELISFFANQIYMLQELHVNDVVIDVGFWIWKNYRT